MTFETEQQGLLTQIAATAQLDDARILAAFAKVPRHLFVPAASRAAAYEDRPLPIGDEQTISQPSMIALMLRELRCSASDRALEIGGGSGYAAALLAQLVERVDAIELRPALAARARENLAEAQVTGVTLHVGDGRLGLPERAPFDVILVSAGAKSVPPALTAQLAAGGRIAIPVGDAEVQTLRIGRRAADGELSWTDSVTCAFVPLL